MSQQFRVTQATCMKCGQVHGPAAPRPASETIPISDEEFIRAATAAIARKTGLSKSQIRKLVTAEEVPPPPSLAKRFQDSAPLLRDEIEPTYPAIIRTAGAEVNGVPPPPSLIATIQASAKRNLKRK